MRIIISSHCFFPSIGGIESITGILAQKWTQMGHHITILTQTPGMPIWNDIDVVRCPKPKAVRELVSNADLYIQNNISLRTILPVFDKIRNVSVLHQTYLGPSGLKDVPFLWMKYIVSVFCRNLAISSAVAKRIPHCREVTGNPYDENIFFVEPSIKKEKDLLFVGRLTESKGVDVLLQAMSILSKQMQVKVPGLSIVGDGPAKKNLRGLSSRLGLGNKVAFLGPMQGRDLANVMNAHKILVVPSSWAEPFGIVALEGAACGCYVIGSNQGGLPDAIGPCGITFPNGDAQALAVAISEAFQNFPSLNKEVVCSHLKPFMSRNFALKLLDLACG